MVVYDGPNYYPACTLTAKLNESMIGKVDSFKHALFEYNIQLQHKALQKVPRYIEKR